MATKMLDNAPRKKLLKKLRISKKWKKSHKIWGCSTCTKSRFCQLCIRPATSPSHVRTVLEPVILQLLISVKSAKYSTSSKFRPICCTYLARSSNRNSKLDREALCYRPWANTNPWEKIYMFA